MRTIVFLSAMITIVLLGSSCTKDFKSYNTDASGITDSALIPDYNSVGLFFPGIQQHLYGEEGDYQLVQNLNADCYAGYYMSPNPFRGNINNENYALVDGWNVDVFNMAYGSVMAPINAPVSSIAAKGARTSAPDFWAIALILQVQAMSRVTDYYGPIPYSKYGATNAAYDSQKDIYNLFFLQLDTAVANLQTFITAKPGMTPFLKFDMVYKGVYPQWLKYANSLRLRLATHIANIDPVTAKAQAVKAMTNTGGLLTTNADNATLSGYGYYNPIWFIGTSWSDLACGASLTSYLNGYNDPRISKMISPATSPSSIAGQYVGIRIGTPVGGKPQYNGYSLPNFSEIQQFTPMILMSASEVWFMRAEAALRGWNNESAQTDYETGVTTSMGQWGVPIGSYLTDNTSKQANYADPLTPAANINAVSNITIAWDEAAGNERKLERIITQKWIANFPCGGQEAWADYRRTGYPRLFPVVVNNSGGSISTDLQIRRIAYPSGEYTSNAAAVAAAVASLGGPDNGGTPIWWDTNKGNAVPVNF